MLTDLEKKWLDYTRDVLGGEPETCCIDRPPDSHIRRWPGYLGPCCAQGRVAMR
jgi:hypothetical protein